MTGLYEGYDWFFSSVIITESIYKKQTLYIFLHAKNVFFLDNPPTAGRWRERGIERVGPRERESAKECSALTAVVLGSTREFRVYQTCLCWFDEENACPGDIWTINQISKLLDGNDTRALTQTHTHTHTHKQTNIHKLSHPHIRKQTHKHTST